ncbi:flagellar brake protein [Alkalicoccobacillus murimartini]|uniref:C-di-GMP-binding flagellar brake protein YcgR n=1 Tax=Alkalicoccobacillus murimartini TaxID=171685 RepID=A0ABT9YDG1_9BACI|nr:flagellar brake domain-containing protein [Alkalicoccobacillus murimartini]MDQ0205898.1 c-di-GMP-binding flagellar brake protein YcgR [Alkalicoccobacillus murimartini]
MEVGMTLYLEAKHQEMEKPVPVYRCRVVDIEDGRLIIDYPINEETKKPAFFYDGTQFKTWWVSKEEAVYSFEATILGRKKAEIPVLVLNQPEPDQIMRMQRREYVRISARADVAVHPAGSAYYPFASTTVDISGGGCAVTLPRNYESPPVGDVVMLYLVLHRPSGTVDYLQVKADIVRVIQPTEHSQERISFEFLHLAKRDREKIMTYIFEKQLVEKKKMKM